MSASALVATAISWLARSFRFWRSNKTEFGAALATLRAAGLAPKVLESLAKGLQKVEETVGAHTSAWPKIARAKKQKEGLTLSAAEVKYLAAFKSVFDRTVKRRFKK